jgi:hypothetical protein
VELRLDAAHALGNGVPDHDTGSFPNSGNPNSISAQTVSVSMPLEPTPAASDLTSNLHIVGYAFNSVKLDPSTAGTCTVSNGGTSCTMDCNMNGSCGQSSTWNIEALGQSSFNFGADANNAHVQPNGAYHYHGMPEGFLTKLGKGAAVTLVGFAMDGYPIYARYGYSVATDATSAIKVLTSSYKVKSAPDAGRPSTATYAMGAFTQDYTYSAGSGDLDECNGRTAVTPEFPGGICAYYITDTWPFIGRCLKGSYTPPSGGP